MRLTAVNLGQTACMVHVQTSDGRGLDFVYWCLGTDNFVVSVASSQRSLPQGQRSTDDPQPGLKQIMFTENRATAMLEVESSVLHPWQDIRAC